MKDWEKQIFFLSSMAVKTAATWEDYIATVFITAMPLLFILSIGLLLSGLSVPPVKKLTLCYQVF
jgi:hypothetical protein